MILQALTEYYQALEREGKIAAPGSASTLCKQNSPRGKR